MSATYTPREGSVAWKVIQFLQANPDEQLDADLISAKCDCDRRNVHTLLGPAVQAELLVRKADGEDGELVYTVGKGRKSAEGRAHQQLSQQSAAPAKARSAPFWIDATTVKIEKDIPLPGRGTRAIDWSPLLDRLEVGDSFQLPAAAKSSVGTAMKAFKDSTGKVLASRKVDGGIRVWRVA